ncbi:transmembrane protein 126 [Calliopsis andreniformis]|uniref:transmembrane protein 126 n=1 Tax=Calliopsis andreniformis TaxID=337506 RepID=UPI003FCDA8B8
MVLIPIKSWDSVTSKNYVYISERDAVEQQKELIRSWEPASEVWAIKHGSTFIALTAGLSSMLINGLFQSKLKLHDARSTFTMIGAMTIPGLFAGYLNETFITEELMLYKNKCPLCYELRATILTNLAGVVFPLVTLPLLNLGIAVSLGLRVPYIYEVKEIAQFWWSVVKPASKQLSLIVATNTVLANMISYKQFVSMETVAEVLLNIHENFEKEDRSLNQSE